MSPPGQKSFRVEAKYIRMNFHDGILIYFLNKKGLLVKDENGKVVFSFVRNINDLINSVNPTVPCQSICQRPLPIPTVCADAPEPQFF